MPGTPPGAEDAVMSTHPLAEPAGMETQTIKPSRYLKRHLGVLLEALQNHCSLVPSEHMWVGYWGKKTGMTPVCLPAHLHGCLTALGLISQ